MRGRWRLWFIWWLRPHQPERQSPGCNYSQNDEPIACHRLHSFISLSVPQHPSKVSKIESVRNKDLEKNCVRIGSQSSFEPFGLKVKWFDFHVILGRSEVEEQTSSIQGCYITIVITCNQGCCSKPIATEMSYWVYSDKEWAWVPFSLLVSVKPKHVKNLPLLSVHHLCR